MAVGDIFYENENGVMKSLGMINSPSYTTSTGSSPWVYPITTNKTTPLYKITEGYDNALVHAAQQGQIPLRDVYHKKDKRKSSKVDTIILDSIPQISSSPESIYLREENNKLKSENQKLKQEIEDLKQQMKSLCENGTKPQVIETEELEKLFE